MSKILSEVLEANQNYAANFGDKKDLALPPARSFTILTCMDARLDPAKYAGLAEGDAHVIRNAGGRASDDAIRSLVISHKLLGTREWFVIHHTDCGMELFDGPTASPPCSSKAAPPPLSMARPGPIERPRVARPRAGTSPGSTSPTSRKASATTLRGFEITC